MAAVRRDYFCQDRGIANSSTSFYCLTRPHQNTRAHAQPHTRAHHIRLKTWSPNFGTCWPGSPLHAGLLPTGGSPSAALCCISSTSLLAILPRSASPPCDRLIETATSEPTASTQCGVSSLLNSTSPAPISTDTRSAARRRSGRSSSPGTWFSRVWWSAHRA